MSDEDYTTAGGANTSNHTPGKHRGPRFSWTPAYEATFFRSLVESTHLNLREGSTFKQEAWDRAIQALIEQHNAFAHKNHLINKSDNARKKFRLWRGLRENPEFHYDRSTRMVTASEDAWKRHIEVRCAKSLLADRTPRANSSALTIERAAISIAERPTVRARGILRASLPRRDRVGRCPKAPDKTSQERQ